MIIELLVVFACLGVFSRPSHSLLIHKRWSIQRKPASFGPVCLSGDRNDDLIPVGKFNFRISNEAENSLNEYDPLGEDGELIHMLGDEDAKVNISETTAFTPNEVSHDFETLESLQSRLLQNEFGPPADEVSFDDLMEAVLKREYLQQAHPYFGEFWEHHKRWRVSWYLVLFQKFVQRLTAQLKRWVNAK